MQYVSFFFHFDQGCQKTWNLRNLKKKLEKPGIFNKLSSKISF